MPLDLPRLLLVHEEETFGVLSTLALEELPANVIDIDEVGPFLVCRIDHAPAFDMGDNLSITHEVPPNEAQSKIHRLKTLVFHAINHDCGVRDMKDTLIEVVKSKPLNITARLVTGAGVHWDAELNQQEVIRKHHSIQPHALIAPTHAGVKFGRFTVRGWFSTGNGKRKGARYSCQCLCGRYELRSWKAISQSRHPDNDDCCLRCEKAKHLQRSASWRAHGFNT